ncbi:YeiH family protein [Kroppenstedtia eburnea]|uniref:YeiH family protein n=1 Tax=Kroppenstedtia eburnea TaxID=714067 RepID=UPI00362B062B
MSEQTLSVQHPDMETKSSGTSRWKGWIGGIFFTFVIAVLGYGLSHLSGFDRIGPLASAIVIAVTFRQFSGYPESIHPGIQFSSKKLLRIAIVLYGLRLNIEVVLHDGLPLLVRGAGTILFAIGLTLLLARWLKANTTVSLLLGVGTGVCGAAAIAAVSPILKTEDEDTAISVGIIALVGTVFAIGYTLIKPLMPLDSVSYGIWSGISLHEIAHVALAAAPAGQDALAIALLAKLGRVFLLVPLCFILIYWMKRKHAGEARANIECPWFLVGFILMSFVGTYLLGKAVPVSESVMEGLSNAASLLLTMAMVGLGLNVHLRDLRNKALRPLIAMVITSVLLSVVTFFVS